MKKETIIKVCANPYFLAVLSIMLMYLIKITPLVFVIAGLFWTLLQRKQIDFKTLLKFLLTFSIIQLTVNILTFLTNAFGLAMIIGSTSWVVFRLIIFFVLSFVVGGLIFWITNIVILGIFKLLNKISTKC